MQFRLSVRRTSLSLATLALLGVSSGSMMMSPHTHAASRSGASSFLSYNAAKHTATLRLVAGYDNTMSGFNFDGGAKGAIIITLPLGTKVVATFLNNVSTPHSAELVPFAAGITSKKLAPAFMGAASPDYINGAEKGDPATTFRFTAAKAGMYRLICAVPGHAVAGMWDTVVVSASARTATFRMH